MMTSKERWLAAIHRQPVDRLPFWPKLDRAYPRAQVAPFNQMDLQAIQDWIGSDKHIGIPACVKEVRSRTAIQTTVEGDFRRTVYTTPHGEMESEFRFDVDSQAWHPMIFPVKTREDLVRMRDVYEDVSVEMDAEVLGRAQVQAEAIGQDAITTNSIGESPLMHLVEWLAGISNAHMLLTDYCEEVEALFEAIHAVLKRKAELLANNSPADVLYMIENTSTTLISPDQYRRYCYGHIQDYGTITRSANKPLILHMCGHLKALLPELSTLPVEAFEAFTSPTLGNTTFFDGRSACPDKCLVGGTNAMLWITPAETIIDQIERDLDLLPHHRGIVVTSAGVMPPFCKPETIKTVCDWVKVYPAEMAVAGVDGVAIQM